MTLPIYRTPSCVIVPDADGCYDSLKPHDCLKENPMNIPPQSIDDYNKRFMANQKISGGGIGNVHMSMPCPFCAAPDFWVYELLEMEEVVKKPATCQECGRSAVMLFTYGPGPSKLMELVQVSGDDPPEWSVKFRRVGADGRPLVLNAHVASEVVNGVQYCSRCGAVLLDSRFDNALDSDPGARFFGVGAVIEEDKNSIGLISTQVCEVYYCRNL